FAIFSIALFVRIAAYIDFSPNYPTLHFFEVLGSGGDADYQMQIAIGNILKVGADETFTHFDYLFIIPTITTTLRFFGLINGLQILMALTILLGSLSPVFIFLALSTRIKYSIGGLVAGLLL